MHIITCPCFQSDTDSSPFSQQHSNIQCSCHDMLQAGLLPALAALSKQGPHLPGVHRSMLGFCSSDPAALAWLLQVPGMHDCLQSSTGQVPIPPWSACTWSSADLRALCRLSGRPDYHSLMHSNYQQACRPASSACLPSNAGPLLDHNVASQGLEYH